jgi:biopolymer transport protein ExbB
MRCLLFAALAVSLCGAPHVLAQETAEETATPRARSLDELLEMVKQGRLRENREHRKREKEFRSQRDQQERLLRQARATLAAEELRSDRLEKTFQDNEARLAVLESQLTDRLGALGELFGVVRQVAGDTRGLLESSVISAQLSGRDAVLAPLASSRTLPSMEGLRRLWIALQEEATESGRVVRFRTPVLLGSGEERELEVVRVGAFNTVSGGQYLGFDNGRLQELPRQPAARHVSTVGDLEAASEGLVGFSLDPSRGQILRVLIQAPSTSERVAQGKMIGYAIIVLGAIGVLLALGQWWYLLLEDRRMKAQVDAETARSDNPLGRILAVFETNPRADVETLERQLDGAVLKEIPRLERFQATIRVLSVVAPLMGLLGTVTGMIGTFQSLVLFGTGDPKMMAGGISEALVTTMLGLMVAIPLVLLHNFVSNRSRAMVHLLDEQSAGMVAARAERLENERISSNA